MESAREFEAGPFRVEVAKSHILKSSCEKGKAEGCEAGIEACPVCRFGRELSLPSLPEMVFPRNCLRVVHASGCALEFCALEALRLVDCHQEPLKVAAAEEWGRSREAGLKEAKDVVKPFDWTFSTSYKGTLLPEAGGFEVVQTGERIDYEKLKQPEKIYFYDEVILFEDELADNGTAVLSVKIRVMASGFFILLRYFLRVDGVLVRLNDTRFYHQAGSDHVLREYSSKESKVSELRVSPALLTDPNRLNEVLTATELVVHKLVLPRNSCDDD